MTNDTRSYKYSCRACTIRRRCINDKNLGPGLRIAVENRFRNRTDTFETWDMLQEDCLLVRYEEQEARSEGRESGLMKRLRLARQTGQPAATIDPPPQTERAPRRTAMPVPRIEPLPEAAVSQTLKKDAVPSFAARCGFILSATERIVRLPEQGELVIGRFEHGFSNPPDVDLAFEDGEIASVSRRHALVTCKRGEHWIEDMGSSNGTYVNGHKLPLGERTLLAPDDRLLLGRCRLRHSPLPRSVLEPDPRAPHAANLVVTHTGQRIALPDLEQIIVGRPDEALGYTPDVDLSVAGDIAVYVSRRHIRLVSRSGWHYVEEIGSAAGTRLNGRQILVGDAPTRLQQGDQLWLGGCVVAYEWKSLRGVSIA